MRRKISNLGRADDIRKKYRDAMRDERFKFPRNNMLSHGVGWYLDGHLISRPLTAVYAFANLAEYMLYYAKYSSSYLRIYYALVYLTTLLGV